MAPSLRLPLQRLPDQAPRNYPRAVAPFQTQATIAVDGPKRVARGGLFTPASKTI